MIILATFLFLFGCFSIGLLCYFYIADHPADAPEIMQPTLLQKWETYICIALYALLAFGSGIYLVMHL